MLNDDYRRGVEMLSLTAPAFASLALAIGKPVENPAISTARVVFYGDARGVFFEMNPTFVEGLTDEQVAAVIGHETYHILFGHLKEVGDRKAYPDAHVLTQAQECIINDGLLTTIGVELGPGYLEGKQLFNTDFSLFSTREGYDFIMKLKEEEKAEEEAPQDEEASDQKNQDEAPADGTSSADDASSPADEPQEDTAPEGASQEPAADDDTASASSASSEDEDGAEEGASEDGSGGCGGMHIEGSPEDFKKAVMDVLNKMASEVDDEDVPDTLKDIIEDFAAEAGDGSFKGFTRDGANYDSFVAPMPGAGLELNWRELLARINPRIKQAGARTRYKESWAAPRRRMISSYPKIILPTIERQEGTKGKGDSIPAVIFALDLSVSIPSSLINDLVSMMGSIPTDIIQPHAVTWSDFVLPFDPKERRLVKRSGTNIDQLYTYVRNFAKTEGIDPYVVVITDGECNFRYANVDGSVKEKWFWMAIEKGDIARITKNFSAHIASPDRIYNRADFTF